MPAAASRPFILTGTSATGKTSLLQSLAEEGFLTFEEPLRAVLEEEVARDGPALPAKDPVLFLERLKERCLSNLETARERGGVSFHDRGLPDLVAYAERFGVVPDPMMEAASAHRYQPKVFVLAPWPEIFVPDTFRGESYAFYETFHQRLLAVYEACGYEFLEVSQVSLEERNTFVLTHISEGVGS